MKAIITIIILFLVSSVSGNAGKLPGVDSNTIEDPIYFQQVDLLIDELMRSNDPDMMEQGKVLHDLVYEPNPTMIIHEGGVSYAGEDNPVVLDIRPSMIGQLYGSDPVYSQIQKIRIMAHSPADLNWVLKVDEMTHFESLRYIFIHTTFELCPETPDNPDCHHSKLIGQVAGLGVDSNVVLVYKVSSIM